MCVGRGDTGGRVVHSLSPPHQCSLMSRGCQERRVEEDSEDDREPGSISNVSQEPGRKGVTSCHKLVIPGIRYA